MTFPFFGKKKLSQEARTDMWARAARLRFEAYQHLLNQDYLKAISAYNNILGTDPDRLDPLLQLETQMLVAQAKYLEGILSEASDALAHALKISQDKQFAYLRPLIFYLKALIYVDMARQNKIQQAYVSSPFSPPGRAPKDFSPKKNLDNARDAYLSALQTGNDLMGTDYWYPQEQILWMFGKFCLEINDADTAIKLLDASLKSAKKESENMMLPTISIDLVKALIRKGELHRANELAVSTYEYCDKKHFGGPNYKQSHRSYNFAMSLLVLVEAYIKNNALADAYKALDNDSDWLLRTNDLNNPKRNHFFTRIADHIREGAYQKAKNEYQRELAQAEKTNSEALKAYALMGLSRVAMADEDTALAKDYLSQALAVFSSFHYPRLDILLGDPLLTYISFQDNINGIERNPYFHKEGLMLDEARQEIFAEERKFFIDPYLHSYFKEHQAYPPPLVVNVEIGPSK